VLDLLEEHVYAGEMLADGRYVAHWSPQTLARVLGRRPPAGVDPVGVFEGRILAEDRPQYVQFGERLLAGGEAETTYRVHGLDGVTRLLRDRARAQRRADGRVLVHGILSDITARAEADARAAEASERFSSLLDVVGAHVYVALAHPDGALEEIFQGPGADRLLGGAEPDPEMVNWEAAVHPEDRLAYDEFNRRLGVGEAAEVEYRLRGADGVTRWVHDRAGTRRREDGIEISGIVSDVTERRRLEDELRRSLAEMEQAHLELERARSAAERRARTDGLTGTYARGHFVEQAEARLASGLRSCGLVLLDADHFKQVNDVHGHAIGDAVLIELARRLGSSLQAGDLLGRWGGEEFAVLLGNVASDAELERRAERLRVAVARTPISAAGVTLNQTVSLGAVRCGEQTATVDALVEAADRRLYAAKRGGRNRVSLVAEADAGARSGEPDAIGMARSLAFAGSVRD
jgi:diguanylate cyclase (GGDEF)-like protein/PAS domain S-box-containing protein